MEAAAAQPIRWMYRAVVIFTTSPQPHGLDGALIRIDCRVNADLQPSGEELHPLTHADGGFMPALPLGNDGLLTKGVPMIILGYPGATGFRSTPTVGVFSRRQVNDPAGHGEFLLTDSVMCQGHSGGPGLNQHGQVVGWNVRHAELKVYTPGPAHFWWEELLETSFQQQFREASSRLSMPSGMNELRPVRLLVEALQGSAAGAFFGGDPALADVREVLGAQTDWSEIGPGLIAADTYSFGIAAVQQVVTQVQLQVEALDQQQQQQQARQQQLQREQQQLQLQQQTVAETAHGALIAATDAGTAAARAQATTALQAFTIFANAEIDARAAAAKRDVAQRMFNPHLQVLLQLPQLGQHMEWLQMMPNPGLQLNSHTQPHMPLTPSHSPSPLSSSSSRTSSPSVSAADFGIVINGDYPKFDEEDFKKDLTSKVNHLLGTELCPRDIEIEPAEYSPGPRARVRMGSCEVWARCVLPDKHSATFPEQDIRAILKELIEEYWPRGLEYDVCQPWVTKLSKPGSIVLILEIPQPFPILLLQLALQGHIALLSSGILCCQLGGTVARLEGCQDRHVDALAKAMEDVIELRRAAEERRDEEELRDEEEQLAKRAEVQAVEGEGEARDAAFEATATAVRAGDTQDSNEVLRGRILQLQSELSQSRKQLAKQTSGGGRTSRAGFLRSLDELIGPRSPEISWDGDAWLALRGLTWRMKPDHGVDPKWSDAELLEHVKAHSTACQYEEQYRRTSVAALTARNWDEGEVGMARCYAVLSSQGPALAKALRERDVAIAPCVHALYDCIYRRSLEQQRRSLSAAQIPELYRHLRGTYSLCEIDENWKDLERPDNTGFRGVCSSGITVADCDPANFDEHGYKRRWQGPDAVIYYSEPSDVVCFVSRPEDAFGAHCAVLTYTDETGAFPPNTLFRLKEVKQPGNWEAPGGNGIFPQQRLLVVTATYLKPEPSIGAAQSSMSGSKMCPERVTLSYGDRNAYVNGIDSLIAKPLLTMEQEFARDEPWKDWKGTEYTAREEWEYVIGPAAAKEGCTAGTRDAGANHGLTPEQFRTRANESISRSRGILAERGVGAGELMEEEDAFLTLNEVLAIRLYSGPAYQPINRFLREVAKVNGVFREQLAQHPELTFTATVRHLCCAIRKLAACTLPEELEATSTLYRGCRGELEQDFWTPDGMGMICAVDMAFMSTSTTKAAPIQHMSDQTKNVLWQLHTSTDSDAGFHRGADISMLSQHAVEHEVLFPPMTLLKVINTPSSVSTPSSDGSWSRLPIEEINKMVKTENAGKKELIIIDVVPCFL